MEATKWTYIGQSYSFEMNKQFVYIDDASISGGSEGPKEAWVQIVDTPPDCSSGYAREMKKCLASGIYYRQYFSDKTFCTIRAANYFTDGTSDGARSYPCRRIKLDSGTAPEVEWKYLFR